MNTLNAKIKFKKTFRLGQTNTLKLLTIRKIFQEIG